MWGSSAKPDIFTYRQTRALLWGASQMVLVVKNPPANTGEMWVQSLGREDPLKEEMATHSSIIAWRIPWTEEAGRLQFIGLQSQTQLRN